MTIVQVDASIRLAGLTILFVLAWLLFRDRRSIGTPALLFPALALCLSGFLIGNTPLAASRLSGVPGMIAHDASGFTVVFLWWFCLSCFDSRFRPRGFVLAAGLAWATIAAIDRGLLGAAFADKGLSRLLVVFGFGIVGHLIWRLATERSGDLIQHRHDARIMTAILLGGMLFIDLAADALFGFGWRPPAFAMAQNAAILGVGLWLAGKLLAVRPEVLTFGAIAASTAPPKTRMPVREKQEGELYRRLAALMETQHIFLDPDLTFAAFVNRMAAPERAVRQLINHELGFDHFRTFLNHYRVAEACRLLADERRADDKLIAIALDSGFASLASFNRAFRTVEGCSPSQYRTLAGRNQTRSDLPKDVGIAAVF